MFRLSTFNPIHPIHLQQASRTLLESIFSPENGDNDDFLGTFRGWKKKRVEKGEKGRKRRCILGIDTALYRSFALVKREGGWYILFFVKERGGKGFWLCAEKEEKGGEGGEKEEKGVYSIHCILKSRRCLALVKKEGGVDPTPPSRKTCSPSLPRARLNRQSQIGNTKHTNTNIKTQSANTNIARIANAVQCHS